MQYLFVISAFLAFVNCQHRAPPGVNPSQYQQPPPPPQQQQGGQQFQQQQQFQQPPPQQFQQQQFQQQPPPQQFQGQPPPQQQFQGQPQQFRGKNQFNNNIFLENKMQRLTFFKNIFCPN